MLMVKLFFIIYIFLLYFEYIYSSNIFSDVFENTLTFAEYSRDIPMFYRHFPFGDLRLPYLHPEFYETFHNHFYYRQTKFRFINYEFLSYQERHHEGWNIYWNDFQRYFDYWDTWGIRRIQTAPPDIFTVFDEFNISNIHYYIRRYRPLDYFKVAIPEDYFYDYYINSQRSKINTDIVKPLLEPFYFLIKKCNAYLYDNNFVEPFGEMDRTHFAWYLVYDTFVFYFYDSHLGYIYQYMFLHTSYYSHAVYLKKLFMLLLFLSLIISFWSLLNI